MNFLKKSFFLNTDREVELKRLMSDYCLAYSNAEKSFDFSRYPYFYQNFYSFFESQKGFKNDFIRMTYMKHRNEIDLLNCLFGFVFAYGYFLKSDYFFQFDEFFNYEMKDEVKYLYGIDEDEYKHITSIFLKKDGSRVRYTIKYYYFKNSMYFFLSNANNTIRDEWVLQGEWNIKILSDYDEYKVDILDILKNKIQSHEIVNYFDDWIKQFDFYAYSYYEYLFEYYSKQIKQKNID